VDHARRRIRSTAAPQHRSTASTLLALFVLPLVCFACSSGDSRAPKDGETGSVRQRDVTDVIPTSATCNPGIGPSSCFNLPPSVGLIATPQPPLWDLTAPKRVKIDGTWGALEYAGESELPYTDFAIRANGKVHLKAFQSKNALGVTVLGTLLVFLEDIPINLEGAVGAGGPAAGYVSLFVDHSRFTGTSFQAEGRDRLYVIDVLQGTLAKVYELVPDGQGGFTLYENAETFPWAKKPCKLDPSMAGLWRCSAELLLPLPADAFAEPAPSLQPGIGLAVFGNFGRGSMPEETAKVFVEQNVFIPPYYDRRWAQTLLLGPPRGFTNTFMSWNVRRSKMSSLGGPYTNAVDDEAIGRYLALNDIVALQEGWNLDMMTRVLGFANARRATYGLPPFVANGPVDFELSTFKSVVAMVAGPVIGNEGSTGGLWVYSSLPVASEGYHSFKACKGEDCFKAKGVQWVRLLLNPPSPKNSGPGCKPWSTDSPASGCDFPPSGGHYVDVFNTHLQADNPRLCQDAQLSNSIKEAIPLAMANPILAYAYLMLKTLAEKDWNCAQSDASVRAEQLQEAAEYIATITANRNDRPVIILGDFNIDGRTLDYHGSNEYTRLLRSLGVGPSLPPGSSSTPRSDIISPWRWDYDWDIDHGDIARERPEIQWQDTPQQQGGRCAGTFIGDLGGSEASNCKFAGNFDGTQRFDYILVKPPTPPDSATFASSKWVAKKADTVDPGVWFSPWPGFTNNHGGPGNRLSDHKPVVATIELAPLVAAPKYHKDWKHNLTIQVVSANGTGEGDCDGQLDMYPRMWAFRQRNGVWEKRMNRIEGAVCGDRNAVSLQAHGHCVGSWGYFPWGAPEPQDPSQDWQHNLTLSMWDADSWCSGDDLLTVVPGARWVQQYIVWNPGRINMQGINDWGNTVPIPKMDEWLIKDVEPIPRCSVVTPTKVCMLCSFPELAPGDQW
jgi:hypothetical protein